MGFTNLALSAVIFSSFFFFKSLSIVPCIHPIPKFSLNTPREKEKLKKKYDFYRVATL